MQRSRVLLPLPERPMIITASPLPHVQVYAAQDVLAAEVLFEAA